MSRSALSLLIVLVLLSVPTLTRTTRARDVATQSAESLVDAYDDPGGAMEYYRLKRVPPGKDQIPVERYLTAQAHIQRMPVYSTALSGATTRARGISMYDNNVLGTWVPLGPGNVGGRTRALLIDPVMPQTMYAAGVAGGVWKTTDGGDQWKPLDDLLPNLAVSSLAMNPHNSAIIYAGTGEGYSNIDSVRGLGIFQTTDAGATWSRLESTANSDFYYVYDIVISPNDTQRLYAGTATGLWSSTDGGSNWSRKLVDAASPECLDLAIRTDEPTDYIFASFGNFTQASVFRNTDASGAGSWTSVLSERGMGRTSLAIAPSDQSVIYAQSMSLFPDDYFAGLLAVFRSVDGGNAWSTRLRNDDPVKLNTMLLSNPARLCGFGAIGNQGWYDNVIAVDPADPNIVFSGGVLIFRSEDGGATWGIAYGLHADEHSIVFHPNYNGRSNRVMFVGNDGGVYRTDNARASAGMIPCSSAGSTFAWTSLNNGYAVTQFYHGVPFPDGKTYFGGTQDNGTVYGTDSGGQNGWGQILGGDGGYVAVAPDRTSILYAETQGLALRRSVNGGSTFSLATEGIINSGFLFIVPFTMDPNNSSRLWTGGESVWRTTDGAFSWVQASTPGSFGSVSALGVAPSNSDVLLTGTSDGIVSHTNRGLSADSNTEWPSASPRVGFVSWVTFDPKDEKTAYATYSSFKSFPTDHHVYRTTDGGDTWASIDGSGDTGIPDIPVHCVIVDPTDTSRLYIGTDLGVFTTSDSGEHWAQETTGFANTVTESLSLTSTAGIVRLFAFTHGRGAFRVRLASFASRITGASITGKKLSITGENFDSGAVIMINGVDQTTRNDDSMPNTLLIAKKGGKKIGIGERVRLQIRNADGTLTRELPFTRLE
jgi:photosystem II stability/assembly factor-like uncharacterized protein